MLKLVLDLLYPPVCGICGKIDQKELCPKCAIKLRNLEKARLYAYPHTHFEKHFYLFPYEGIIREKLIHYKFQGKSYLSTFFAKILQNHEKMSRLLEKYDIIIPVPMYSKKEKLRGYNQTALIAKEIAKAYQNLIYDGKSLQKIKDTKMQSSLNKKQRKNNIKNAYNVINQQKIKDKKIVLLDDIYTTGATANECSKMLKQAGAKEILVVTIAKD